MNNLRQSLRAIAELYGVSVDDTDPFSVMPKEVQNIELVRFGRKVDIVRTVECMFSKPGFFCSDVRKFWKLLLEDPEEFLVGATRTSNSGLVFL